MKVSLVHVLLINPVNFDRLDMPMSTLIAGPEWRFEAEMVDGRLGDIHMFKNLNARDDSKPAAWSAYGWVPASSVRGYRLGDGEPAPKPGDAPAKGAPARA